MPRLIRLIHANTSPPKTQAFQKTLNHTMEPIPVSFITSGPSGRPLLTFVVFATPATTRPPRAGKPGAPLRALRLPLCAQAALSDPAGAGGTVCRVGTVRLVRSGEEGEEEFGKGGWACSVGVTR